MKPNLPYLAGTATIPTATTDYALLENIFSSLVASYGVDSWRDLIPGVANDFYFTYNKQITVKYGQIFINPTTQVKELQKGLAAVWRNPTPSTLTRSIEGIQKRENYYFRIDEIYITNAAGSDVTIDIEIRPCSLAPFNS